MHRPARDEWPDFTAPDELARLLGAAGVTVPRDVVETWGLDTRADAAEWALAIVTGEEPVPPRPAVLSPGRIS